MAQILRRWRVTLAALFALVLIVGSFLIARDVESPYLAQASTEAALLQAIATKDSDNDGLADWEESLYGTNSQIVDSFNLGMADGVAVEKGLIVPEAIDDIPGAPAESYTADDTGLPPPAEDGTLTAGFSQRFFELYLAAKQANGGKNLSSEETATIANATMDDLFGSVTMQSDYKAIGDLTISGSGSDALKTFAADAQQVLIKNAAEETIDEITYLQQAVENDDADALIHLAAIAKANRNSAAGLSALPIPKETAPSALALINSLMRLSEIINDFSHVNSDPLMAMLALGQYLEVSEGLWQAFESVGNAYAASGVTFDSSTPGAAFVHFTTIITNVRNASQP